MKDQSFYGPLMGAAVVLSAVLCFLCRQLLLSPLSKIPKAHWSSGISSVWILWQRWNGRELQKTLEAHQKFGPIVRLGPSDLSVSCYQDGIRKIYGGGFDKPAYYDFFTYYGKRNTFSSRSKHQHAFHRRNMSTPYTKSSLFGSPELLAMTKRTIYERLIPRLAQESRSSRPSEILELSYALCLDLITQFIFGFSNASNFLQEPAAKMHEWLEHYDNRFCPESFWTQELPRMTRLLSLLGIDLMPKGHAESTQWIEDWTMKMYEGAARTLQSKVENQEDTPLVFNAVFTAWEKTQLGENTRSLNLSVASELFDNMTGAREVLGLVLAYTIYYIARHPTAQQTLREELRAARVDMSIHRKQDGSAAADDVYMPAPQALDKLPYLSAVLQESFRMRPNSTPLPRITPEDRAVSLAGYGGIPPGTRVNSFQWFVHRDPTRWEAVDEWRPERWLEDDSRSNFRPDNAKQSDEARLWAFGSGPRICVGVHLTQYLMRYIIASIFTNFKVSVVEPGSFGRHAAGSLEDKLWLRFEELAA
ncbi:cytochrome P450 [Xylaria intraflava]|nr:cytochrome P450 [Xylaria intraflava]